MSIKTKIIETKNTINNKVIPILLGGVILWGVVWSINNDNEKAKEAMANQIITEEAVIDCLKDCRVEEYLELQDKFESQQKALQDTEDLKNIINQEISK